MKEPALPPKDIEALLNDDWHAVLRYLVKNDRSFNHLDLRGKAIDNKGARGLAVALENNTRVNKLNLNSNNIGDEGTLCSLCFFICGSSPPPHRASRLNLFFPTN